MKKIEKNHSLTNHGFTLVEIIVVVVIIAIFLAVGYPFYRNWYAGINLRTVSRQVNSDLAWAKSEAIRLNSDVAMVLLPLGPSCIPSGSLPPLGGPSCCPDGPPCYLIFQDDGVGGGVAGDGILNLGSTEKPLRAVTFPPAKGPFINPFLTSPAGQSLGFTSRGLPSGRLGQLVPGIPTIGSIQVASTRIPDTFTTSVRVAGSILTTTP
jgi:prepilin-type N-terminal cleavage/methylation domain-containing protein